ncbi:type II secretion system ATPase GspE [Neptuniibacter sp. QD34_54]|uniref:type II secretion system ATPase GspE n=1 Tax=Neptuniibacter sp. QD34_54 TaxID=3398208 RepID=UPI0039F54B4A
MDLSFAYVKEHQVLLLPVSDAGERSLFYTDQTKPEVILEIQRATLGDRLHLEQIENTQLLNKAERFFADDSTALELDLVSVDDVNLSQLLDELPEHEDLLEQEQNAPVVRLINGLFAEALKRKASDIHVETYEQSVSIRLRQDGVLQEVLTPDRRLAPLLISRIKVMAKLDIAEKRIPQDGRITVRIAGRPVDVRVSTLPTSYGERVVMRILDQKSVQLDFDHLGVPQAIQKPLSRLLQQPNGILLVTGPTGSGKTTTLYAGLSLLNESSRNILTVEDPIEYELQGIGQTQVNSKTGMSFAGGLRAMLRQDPDVVMVGEIRDIETAQIAVQASLTGHMVLSTLHTNDAPSAVTRLLDIGVEPYLIASSLRGVLAQRLVRKLCTHCRTEVKYAKDDLESLGFDGVDGFNAYKAEGCNHCGHSGYSGRQGIYELLVLDDQTARLLHHDQPEEQLRNLLNKEQATLQAQAINLVKAGVTDLTEVLRTVRSL